MADSKAHNIVVVCLPDFVQAFYTAIVRFTTKVKSDPELRDRVFHHVQAVPLEIFFKFKERPN